MVRRLASSIAIGVAAAALTSGCVSTHPVMIEMMVRPAVDLSAFRRVLVAGFIAGGTDEVEADIETTQLLRSQLRSRSPLEVIEAHSFPLQGLTGVEYGRSREAGTQAPDRARPKSEEGLDAYRDVFAQAAFWKRIGEEYQQPLIVTGTVLFRHWLRVDYVQDEEERFGITGRRAVIPVQRWEEKQGYDLALTVVVIDGQTGNVVQTDTYREEVSFSPGLRIPALSAYFELMARVLPAVVRTVSPQRVRAYRVLLK